MNVRRALCLFCMCQSFASAQLAKTYRLEGGISSSFPLTNIVNDIVVRGDTIWFGTDRGLSETLNQGVSWFNYAGVAGFDNSGISAVAINDKEVWVASAGSMSLDGRSIPVGAGLRYSADRGQSWSFVRQPVDSGLVDTLVYGKNKIKALDITTSANNISYDLALTSTAVWSAAFAGMLRKSTDRGSTWRRIILPPDAGADSIKPSDSLDFDLSPSAGKIGLRGNLNHRVFSVFASSDSVLWVGTAGGINKTTDGGTSWRKYSHANQSRPISGNFVVAINEQRWRGKTILWAATVNADAPDEQRGISFTENGGATWSTALLGQFVHNISFKDSIVYAAADQGLFRSADQGTTWMQSGSIADASTSQRFASGQIYTVAAKGDTIWIGGVEGIAYTIDNAFSTFGTTWHVFRTSQAALAGRSTYAYPNPFSPNYDVVRLHYSTSGSNIAGGMSSVTIRIFDFGMHPVRTLLRGALRGGTTDQFDEIWDGRDDSGRRVANGVYFYRVEIAGLDSVWGKIFVLQ